MCEDNVLTIHLASRDREHHHLFLQPGYIFLTSNERRYVSSYTRCDYNVWQSFGNLYKRTIAWKWLFITIVLLLIILLHYFWNAYKKEVFDTDYQKNYWVWKLQQLTQCHQIVTFQNNQRNMNYHLLLFQLKLGVSHVAFSLPLVFWIVQLIIFPRVVRIYKCGLTSSLLSYSHGYLIFSSSFWPILLYLRCQVYFDVFASIDLIIILQNMVFHSCRIYSAKLCSVDESKKPIARMQYKSINNRFKLHQKMIEW